jgi:hypothetical protein
MYCIEYRWKTFLRAYSFHCMFQFVSCHNSFIS